MAHAASLAAAWQHPFASLHTSRQLVCGGAQALLGALVPVQAGAASAQQRRRGLETAASTSALTPSIPSTVTLTRKQADRVEDILKARAFRESKTARRRHLQQFIEEARTGAHDTRVPVISWLQVVLGRTGRAALLPAEAAGSDGGDATQGAVVLRDGGADASTYTEEDLANCATERLPGHIFHRPVNPQLLYQVVRWQRAKARKKVLTLPPKWLQGTASSKTRAEVRGGGRKPHSQKGSGRARAGTIRAPHMRGGGVTFGPKPRSFAFKLNKQIRKAGLMAALAAKAAAGRLLIVDNFVLPVADERTALRRVLLQEMPAIKATDVARVSVPNNKAGGRAGTRKPGLLRTEVYRAIGFDTSLLGTQDPAQPGGLTQLYPDEQIADNIMERIQASDSLEPGELLYRTGWFRKHFVTLVPKAWRDRQSPVARADRILSQLNGPSGQRERALSRDRALDPRLSVLIVDSNQDFGEYEGNMLRRIIRNIQGVDALPAKGLNVYDILRREGLVMTRDGLRETIERLERPILRGFKRKGYDWRGAVEERRTRAAEDERRRGDVDAWLRERGVDVPDGDGVSAERQGVVE